MSKIATKDGYYEEQAFPNVQLRRLVFEGGEIPDHWDYPSEGDSSVDETKDRVDKAIEAGEVDKDAATATEEAKPAQETPGPAEPPPGSEAAKAHSKRKS
jgi:hypothetical protein